MGRCCGRSRENTGQRVKNVADGFGKYEVYTEFASLYCYRGSNVLKNRYHIRDAETLRKLEQDYVGAKQQYLLGHPIPGKFSLTHLRKIHRFLFGDIYPFGGRFRLESIRKGDTVFVRPQDIGPKLKKLLLELKGEKYLTGYTRDVFLDCLAYYMAELNYIHPFREGNGRATREFFRLLAARNGYEIDWMAAGRTALLDAMVVSLYDASDLRKVLERCVSK